MQITSKVILNGAITGNKISDTTITGSKLANGEFTGAKLVNGSIDGIHLSTDAIATVLANKFLDATVLISNLSTSTSNGIDVSTKVFDSLTAKRFGAASELGLMSATLAANSPYVALRDDDATRDSLDDGTGKQIYGKLVHTLTETALTGTWTNGVNTITLDDVTGLSVGDIIAKTGETDIFYKITNIATLTVTFDRVFAGTTGAATVTKIVINLNFYKKDAGVETAHTFTANNTIAANYFESFNLNVLPKDALSNLGKANGENLPESHEHSQYTLTSLITSTASGEGADDIGFYNGGTTLSSTNAGAAIREVADVTRLDSRYFTETELGAATGTTGADRIGYDNTTSGLAGSTVQDALDNLSTAVGNAGIVEFTELKTIITLNTIPDVTYTPQYPTSARLRYAGITQIDAFTLNTNKSCAWDEGVAGFDLEVNDKVYITYAVKLSDLP
ncbi:MAG: hypothetical protein KKD01_19840 [Proteobacteria bacterium]|nr:hypothetical protein [Pseudomonadota bacterium]